MTIKLVNENKYLNFKKDSKYELSETKLDGLHQLIKKYFPQKAEEHLKRVNTFQNFVKENQENWHLPEEITLKKPENIKFFTEKRIISSVEDLKEAMRIAYPIITDYDKTIKLINGVSEDIGYSQYKKREELKYDLLRQNKNHSMTEEIKTIIYEKYPIIIEEVARTIFNPYSINFLRKLKGLVDNNLLEEAPEQKELVGYAIFLKSSKKWFAEKNRNETYNINDSSLFPSPELAKKRMGQLQNKDYMIVPIKLLPDFTQALNIGTNPVPDMFKQMQSTQEAEKIKKEVSDEPSKKHKNKML